MTADKHLLELAAKLADGIAVTDDVPELDSIKTVAWISAAFLSSQDAKTKEPVAQSLFQWGHLNALEKLGEGGFGEVFRAYDGVLDRDVALKLRNDVQGSHAGDRAFIREARCLARVRHPNVLAIHGADVHEGRVGLWMDLLEGQNLKHHFETNGCMDVDTCYVLAQDMAAALAAVHHADLVHGDVKASNVMVMVDNQFVLMDFGAGGQSSNQNDSQTAGTPLVMAPELFTGAALSPRTDQYSLGVLLFRQLSGEYPVEAKTGAGLEQAHAVGTTRSLAKLCPRLPRGLIKLVDSLLCVDPASRPTAAAVATKVRWLLDAPKRRAKTIALVAFFAVLAAGTLASSLGYLSATRSEAKAVTSQHETEVINNFLNRILFSANTLAKGPEVKVLDVLDEAATHAGTLSKTPIIQASLLHTLGKTFSSLGQLQKAESALRESQRLRTKALGEAHNDTLWSMYFVGTLLGKQGKRDESRRILETVLRRLQSHHKPDHQLIGTSKVALANALIGQGELDDAETLLQEAEPLFVDGPPTVVGLRLGLMFQAKGKLNERRSRYAAAEQAYRQALDHFLSAGDQNANSISARGNIANMLIKQGKLAAAEEKYRKNLNLIPRLIGENHPSALANLGGLGTVAMEQGRYADALPLAEAALALSVRVQGDEHLQTATIRNNIANIKAVLGDMPGAEAMMRLTIQDAQNYLGQNHLQTFMTEYNLAELLNNTGRYREAEAMARETYGRKLETLGESHHLSLESLDNIGVSLWGQGELQESRVVLEKVLAGKISLLGSESPHTLNTLAHLARTLASLGRKDLAEVAYKELVETRKQVLGAAHPHTLEAIAARAAL